MRRVLAPGGALAILDSTQPPNKPFASVYKLVLPRVLPVLGGADLRGAGKHTDTCPNRCGKFQTPNNWPA